MSALTSIRSNIPRLPAPAACVVWMVWLCGCNVGPRYHMPAMPAPPEYKEMRAPDGSNWQTVQPGSGALAQDWWSVYRDAELDSLIQELNRSNQTIAQAVANYDASRALVRQAHASLYPTVSVSLGYTRERSAITLTGRGSNPNGNLFTAPITFNWEADLWGRLRNQVREQANAAQVSAADLQAQKLSQQAALASYLFELRGQDALTVLYQRTVATDLEALHVTQVRYRTGLDNEETVAQAQITLRSAEAAVTGSQIIRAQYEHAIALLIGKAPSNFELAERALDTEPPAIPVGIPSQLLERRPDIAAVERTMAAANALIGVGKAAYYPVLNLSGTGGVESTNARQWFDWPARFFATGPSLTETVYDGGLRRAVVAQYTAIYNADAALYRQTVLEAFGQTEDALVATRLLATQRIQEQQTVDAAQRYFDLASVRYKTGLDPFLNVFTAQQTLLASQQTLLVLRIQQMITSVQLIQTLGGGWDRSLLPTEKQVGSR